jgi:hypothetical protein
MSDTILRLPPQESAALPRYDYLNSEHGLMSWLLTRDHKRIAILYLIALSLFFCIGGFFAGMIRLELLTPMPDLVASDTYNKLFSMHGIIMVFLFLVPSVPASLGNFLIPLMIGAKDLAFPRINLLSWYLYILGGVITLAAMAMGGVDTGWTFVAPLSTHYLNTNVITIAVGIFVAGFSSIFTGLNFLVTIHRMRAPGMTWFRLPLFVWANYAAAIIMVLATPVLAIALTLVGLERAFGIGVFDPTKGGDPLLFEHLFWFYSHPAVYIMILPGMGVISGRSAFGDQDLQLGADAAAWVDHIRDADAVCVRIYGAVYDWRFDGGLSGVDGDGHPADGDLLPGGALPLCDGGRDVDGVSWGAALLVAEDDGEDVSGESGSAGGGDYVYRIQSDVSSAVCAGVSGDAATLSRVSAGVSGAERDVDGGSDGVGSWVSDARVLPPLVAAVRGDCWR